MARKRRNRPVPVDLYRTTQAAVWRLETLQHYEVPGDEERQSAFHAGEPLPPPRRGKREDLEFIASLRANGRQVGRVHIVDRPLSPYIRYELAVYAENVAAGEDVRIADRSLHPQLAALTQDFVIADPGGTHPGVMLFDYSDSGLILGYRADCSRKAVAACREQLALALAVAVPLAEFLAVVPSR